MRASRLIFVEGILGSGKSTTASFIARQLRRNGVPARYIFEGGEQQHPTRLMRDLPRPFKPWLDLTPTEYRARVLDKWRAFVTEICEAETVAVFDGQLFHGNLTDLLLMDTPRDELDAFVQETLAVTAELTPLLIYFHQDDVAGAVKRVSAERGRAWEQYQVTWKLASPYAERRGLSGLDGLIELYRAYREMTDQMVADLGIETLRIENSGGDWPAYRRQILTYLRLPLVDDPDTSWWPEPKLPAPTIWGDDTGRSVVTTGQPIPELASFDEAMIGLLKRWQLPGGALALARGGRLILARGYGLANIEANVPVQPDSLFRIASISTPFTAAAILKLVEEGRLDLDAPALPLLTDLLPPDSVVDERVRRITIRHLLQHSGGWDRNQSFDMFHQSVRDSALALGYAEPIGAEAIIRTMLARPLDFEPGTRFSYSHLGYCILGRVIERVTGRTYEDVVQTEILRPLGLPRMQIGRSMVEGLAEGEVRYYDPGATTIAPGTSWWSMRAADASGGWIASAVDLVRFLSALDGLGAAAPLRAETVALMRDRPAPPLWVDTGLYHGLGWFVRTTADTTFWWHEGDQPRTIAQLVGNSTGFARAVLFNTCPEDRRIFQGELGQAMNRAYRAVSTWPAHDLSGHELRAGS